MKDFYSNNDKVFREKITSHEFKFDPSAWDKMEKMLDDEDPRKAIAWRYPYMMMILGVFFLGITLLSPSISSDTEVANSENINATPARSTKHSPSSFEPTTTAAISKAPTNQLQSITFVKSQPAKTTSASKVIIETPVYNTTNSVINSQNITPSNLETTPIGAVKTYIETIPSAPIERENIQAFMEVNSLLEPVKYDESIATTLPIEIEPALLKNKRVKVGVQAGASVVVAKRNLADQGKIATAIGGFIDFDIDSKNSITIEANYKNGFSKGTILARKNRQDHIATSTNVTDPDIYAESFDNYIRTYGYTEVNNIERVHSVEIPVIYKRKIGKRNSIIAGVKPSILKFKNKVETEDLVAESELSSPSNLVLDFGLVGGFEHQINKNLSVDVRYNQGLLDISEIEQVKNTNSELALTMKYTF